MIVPAVALNVFVVSPAPTVTEAGTVRPELFEATATADPPDGAACDNVTVHVEVAAESRLVGEHCNEETVGRVDGVTVTTPPVPEIDAAFPSGRDPSRLLIGIGTELLLIGVRFTVTTATTPLPIGPAFMPLARQVIEPLAELQFTPFPAAIRAGPAAVLSELTLLVGYESVHCKPEGAFPETVMERFKATDPPCAPEPEARLKEVPCAKRQLPDIITTRTGTI